MWILKTETGVCFGPFNSDKEAHEWADDWILPIGVDYQLFPLQIPPKDHLPSN